MAAGAARAVRARLGLRAARLTVVALAPARAWAVRVPRAGAAALAADPAAWAAGPAVWVDALAALAAWAAAGATAVAAAEAAEPARRSAPTTEFLEVTAAGMGLWACPCCVFREKTCAGGKHRFSLHVFIVNEIHLTKQLY